MDSRACGPRMTRGGRMKDPCFPHRMQKETGGTRPPVSMFPLAESRAVSGRPATAAHRRTDAQQTEAEQTDRGRLGDTVELGLNVIAEVEIV